MYTITTAIIKGGTGKTATAAAIAQAARKAGRRVLCIDLDPQANFSFSIGADQNAPGAFDLITGTPAADLIQHTPQGLDAITASPDLSTLLTKAGSGKRLRAALEGIRAQYDYCVIDTPPTLGEMIYNALQASDGLIIPLEADQSGLQGLYQIADIAHHITNTNPDLQILGAVITRYDPRSKLTKYLTEVIENAGKEAGAPVIGKIRAGIAVREAAALQQDLFTYAPHSKPTQDYADLFKAVDKAAKKAQKARK